MCEYKHKVTRNTKNKKNGLINGEKKSPETDAKELEVYELLQKEIKLTIMKIFNELRKLMYEQNKNLKKEIENI